MAKERSVDQLVCLWVPPAPVYKGARGEEAAGQGGRAKGGGVLLPPGVGLPSFLVGIGEGGKEEEEGKERGAPPPFPCPIRTREGRGRGPPLASSPLLPYGPCRPNNPPGGSGNLPVLR